MSQATESPRARYRKQVQDEVQARAWEQIGQAGASALSLKAIATQMGMTAPALYRYYGSRDDLLTQLILNTYRELAELFEATAVAESTPTRQLAAIAHAWRNWAVGHPQRYLLLYGTPVPGYHAPPEATGLAQRIFAPILTGFAAAAGEPPDTDPGPSVLASGMRFWTRLHGVLSLELAGHFVGMNVDADQLYADETHSVITDFGAAAAPAR